MRRFVLLSDMGADPAKNHPADPLVQSFLRARGRAGRDLLAHPALDCTVVRPGWFRDGPGTGPVHPAAPGDGGSAPPRRTSRSPPPNPLNPLRQPPCPHTRRTVFGLNHRFSLRRRHQTRIPERDNPRTVKGSDRP
ncbi:SDR family oxidoreductase [Streptomyces sp. NBC_00264]|uniref:NAD(P)H-binding protein n=1 Tax=unclassified Streptomyces TaxID=2593676 RepID=UPI002254FD70|nr:MULTISPECIES: NAD(P)H-binding protein [unclassified Streptomyces]MCX5165156.1 SDR family oxidoreductase [Streptomyces sp. NBC_00305]MCX5223679.1 SDR family oxidoreductase [Streptomyces sp. NBC_00264]